MPKSQPRPTKLVLPEIVIVPARQLRSKIARSGWPFRTAIGSVLSLENPGYAKATVRYPDEDALLKRGYAPRLEAPEVRQLIIAVEDSHSPRSQQHATLSTIHTIAAFAIAHIAERPHTKFAVQCAQGISRSTATSLAIEIAFHQASRTICDPEAMVKRLLQRRPKAAPDDVIVACADTAFNLGGTLIRAVDSNGQIAENRNRHRQKLYGYRP